MHCKDCKHRERIGMVTGNTFICGNNKKISEGTVFGKGEENTDELRYSYEEGGCFEVGPMFGCVHFKQGEIK